jgi:signal transduction histidine kinase/ActR/RegA family two-component response regulator
VNMPAMNGFDTAAMIHQHPRFEKTPIIFVTAVHVTNLDQLKGYELGAVDYCYVPIIPEVLRGKVQVLVELYVKRRELERANIALEKANELLRVEKTRELEQANTELEKANKALQREVTERERFENELQEADRRKDEFLAMLSHELRNPLAAIGNVAHLMKALPHVDPQLVWARDVLDRQTTHLKRLIDDLLDISRIARGRVTLRLESLDLRSVVDGAVETTRTLIIERGHALSVQVPETPVNVMGDQVRLTQVVDNILTNAAKYTEQGGRIDLTLEMNQATNEALIRIKDNGRGIARDTLPDIFQLFRRIDTPHERSQGGLGIGLAVSRGLVEMHNGRIDAHSEGLARGSEFTVRLPLSAQGTDKVIPKPPEHKSQPGVLRILVVDDSVDSAESMSLVLGIGGHEVRVEHNGPDALRAAEEYRPDVVLMDIGMPGMNGYEVARKMRESPDMRQAALIAMTGYGRQADRDQSKAAGFNHHLVKPVDFDTLHNLLSTTAPASKVASGG